MDKIKIIFACYVTTIFVLVLVTTIEDRNWLSFIYITSILFTSSFLGYMTGKYVDS